MEIIGQALTPGPRPLELSLPYGPPSVSLPLRTAAWYDEELTLTFPNDWDVTCYWPRTPPPLSGRQILDALERPVGQPPVRELARGASRPLVIVDDLTRPTPASWVLPPLLRQFEEAGIPAKDVTILMATGAHGPPPPGAMERKIGPEAASGCHLRI